MVVDPAVSTDVDDNNNRSGGPTAAATAAATGGSDVGAAMKNPFTPPLVRISSAAAAAASSSAASTAALLDRSLFSKTVPLAAATVNDRRRIAEWRQKLGRARELLLQDRLKIIQPLPESVAATFPEPANVKCLLLDPKVQPGAPETWSEMLRAAVEQKELGVIPYDLALDYDTWDYEDVIHSIIPPEAYDEHDQVPSGFNSAGHVAHLNLRDAYLPYKRIIAQVLIDKNPIVRTVINKVANVGDGDEFRTFAYEILAGEDDLNVELRENDCIFRFDYSKVYWNSKLHGEHSRLIDMFRPGEVVCDVMAGIGPFAIPAGKKGVFVWANDYNPESYKYLDEGLKRNKVSPFVRAFNRDGRDFIKEAADSVYEESCNGGHAVQPPTRAEQRTRRHEAKHGMTTQPASSPKRIPLPPTISHFVMNLPASAISFLSHFRGVYAGREELFAPHTETRLPMVHVHCFAPKVDGDGPLHEVCERVSAELGFEVTLGDKPEASPGTAAVHNVRTVAPNKDMFCASFRLPPEVAFAPRNA